MDFEGINFDDVIADAEKKKKKKKKKNSGEKGKRGERNLAKVLKERFGFEFTRTVGSGNRWGQVSFLPQHATDTYSGDIVCPENFKFVIECKDGYNDLDLHFCVGSNKGYAKIDSWIEQSIDEAKRSERLPIITWKKDYKPWVALVRKIDLPMRRKPYLVIWKYFHMIYIDWAVLPLTALLELPDEFWFKEAKGGEES